MSDGERLLEALAAHDDYEELTDQEYARLSPDGYPLYELGSDGEAGGYRVEIHPVTDGDGFVAMVYGGVGDELPAVYCISPSQGVETSLEVLERAGFEHLTTDPPRRDEDPFQEVFDIIEQAAGDAREESADTGVVFDGRYQCRECGSVQKIRMFAGAAKPPKKIGTDCDVCGGERQHDGVAPDAESVMHRWWIAFENVQKDPYQVEVTADSRLAARKQVENEHPDRTIEIVCHEEKL